MTQDEFLMWLFEKFNMPESQYKDLTRIYGKSLPENSDFDILKNAVINEWRSPKTLPTTNWLCFRIRPKKQANKELDPEIKKIKADKAFFNENLEACQNAMKECMAHYEKLTGKKLRRPKQCF